MAAPTIKPPFTENTARAKVKAAEDAWNSRDPDRVALAYTPDSEWRNRTEFFHGREAIRAFLRRKWAKELDYKLMKELWCYTDRRISVRFEYEWRDADTGQWMRTHGNEHWEFNDEGLMRRREGEWGEEPGHGDTRRRASDRSAAAHGAPCRARDSHSAKSGLFDAGRGRSMGRHRHRRRTRGN